ncbi:CapA family protein [Alkalibacter mobilis]|uniref:CapA family protein n=1 Tax=Alkalibacter mobilis TaxID=2787712 RepID=UPI0018A0E578|nr:CapA family protein [Alkalibacter mobilis]MBF7096607.1 CapA family protein [Alkalibacter mobilis]
MKNKLNYLRAFIVAIVLFVGIYGITNFEKNISGEIPNFEATIPASDLRESFFAFANEGVTKSKSSIRISSAGDIMTHGTQIAGAYNSATGEYEFDENFMHVAKYFKASDISVANFETVTSGGAPQGYPVFNSPPAILDAIKNAGFNMLGTANNHTLDQGKKGLLNTLAEIQNRDINSTGTFAAPEADITVMEAQGIKMGILAYTYGLNGLDGYLTTEELDYMVNIIDEDKIRSDIAKAQTQGCDAIVVIIHWGNEYQMSPTEETKKLAEKIFGWGADIILGSHPHVIQMSEVMEIDGEIKYVIYSQGNFLSNQRRETLPSIENRNYTEDGVIVHISLEKDPGKNKTVIASVSYTPTWVYRYESSGKFKYQILPVSEALESGDFTGELLDRLKKSRSNTMSKMQIYNGDVQ